MQPLLRSSSVAVVLAISGVGAIAREARAQSRPPIRVAQQPASAAPSSAPSAPAGARGASAGQPAQTTDDAQWRQGPQITPVRPARQPFTLSAEQEKQLDEALKKWEEKGEKIKSFKCDFTRWEYDTTYGDPGYMHLKKEGNGSLRYWAPDHGKFVMNSCTERVAQAENQPFKKVNVAATDLEHWVCDGDSIYEVSAANKQLIQHKLPPEMRGKAISDGPLPFVFGTKADQVKRRYFVRLVTPPEEVGKRVWIEAWPKFQSDAANYQRVTIQLTDPDYLPYALQVFPPGAALPGTTLKDGKVSTDADCSRTVYLFVPETLGVNGKFDWLSPNFWLPPIVPPTWTKIVQEPGGDDVDPAAAKAAAANGRAPAAKSAPPTANPQAQRLPATPQRR